MLSRRVVVTGMGAISAAGTGVNELWQKLISGESCIREHACGIAAGAVDIPELPALTTKDKRRMARFQLLAVAACAEALAQAKIDPAALDPRRFGVIVGSAAGGLEVYDRNLLNLTRQGSDAVSALFIPSFIVNSAAGILAIRYGAAGVNFAPVTACASGTTGIGEAYKTIRCGQADVMISGGSDACITPGIVAGFQALTALSSGGICRPFDRDRDGFVLGEGAGILILEELEHARRRGAEILAEVSGYGAGCDAYHITAPAPDGSGTARAMADALADAGIAPEQLDYLCAHGTGTRLNDLCEAHAVGLLFGDRAQTLPVSSIKSVTGHAIGGSGALESIACIMAIRCGIIPPTVNCMTVDPECRINVVTSPLRAAPEYVLNNSLGFGGHNAALVFKRYKEI